MKDCENTVLLLSATQGRALISGTISSTPLQDECPSQQPSLPARTPALPAAPWQHKELEAILQLSRKINQEQSTGLAAHCWAMAP